MPSSRLSCSARCASVLVGVRLDAGALLAHQQGDDLELRAHRRHAPAPRWTRGLDLAHGAGEHRDDAVVVEVAHRGAGSAARCGVAPDWRWPRRANRLLLRSCSRHGCRAMDGEVPRVPDGTPYDHGATTAERPAWSPHHKTGCEPRSSDDRRRRLRPLTERGDLDLRPTGRAARPGPAAQHSVSEAPWVTDLRCRSPLLGRQEPVPGTLAGPGHCSQEACWLVPDGGAGGNRTRVLRRRSRASPGAVSGVVFSVPALALTRRRRTQPQKSPAESSWPGLSSKPPR